MAETRRYDGSSQSTRSRSCEQQSLLDRLPSEDRDDILSYFRENHFQSCDSRQRPAQEEYAHWIDKILTKLPPE